MKRYGIKFVSIALLIFLVGFSTNLVWEMTQMPLYIGPLGFWQHIRICTLATFGDVGILFILYGIVAGIRRDTFWLEGSLKTNLPLLVLFGVLIAITVEVAALHTNRWQYTASMPLIPILKVGLVPVLQMVLLPPITFWVTNKIIKHYGY